MIPLLFILACGTLLTCVVSFILEYSVVECAPPRISVSENAGPFVTFRINPTVQPTAQTAEQPLVPAPVPETVQPIEQPTVQQTTQPAQTTQRAGLHPIRAPSAS